VDNAGAASIPEAFRRCAASHGTAPAVSAGGRRVTFADLDAAAGRVAGSLLARGAGPERLIGLCCPRSVELLAAFLGVLKTGAAAVLLDPAWPPARTAKALADLPVLTTLRPDDVRQALSAPPSAAPASPSTVDALAYVVCTSGSTGTPKAVGVTHRSVLHCAQTHRRSHAITAGSRHSWLTSPGSSAGVGEVWPALLAGACVVVGDDGLFDAPAVLRDWILAERISHLFAPTPVARLLFDFDWAADSPLRTVSVGGERVRSWPPADLPFTVTVDYGSAEANGVTSGLARPDRLVSNHNHAGLDGPPPIGYPWPDVDLVVLDAGLRPVPAGERGELVVASPELARGYLNDRRETARRFVPNPFGPAGSRMFRTGDVVTRPTDGPLWFHGRLDDVVTVRGHNVALSEVEAAVHETLGWAEAVVVAVELASQTVLACLVAAATVDTDAARSRLAAVLPAYAVPAEFHAVAAVPMLPNRKVDRGAAARIALDRRRAALSPAPAPADAMVRAMVDLWREVLDGADCGADTEFFLAGGNSLSMLRLLAAVEKRFLVRLRNGDVLRNATPRRLTELVRQRVTARSTVDSR
jgi:amino acid adenylation domain-containing protein